MLHPLKFRIDGGGLKMRETGTGCTDIKIIGNSEGKSKLPLPSSHVLDIEVIPTSDNMEVKYISFTYITPHIIKPYQKIFAGERDVGALRQNRKSVVQFIEELIKGISAEEKELILKKCIWTQIKDDQAIFDHFIITVAVYYIMYDLFLQEFFWIHLPTTFSLPTETLSVEILYKNNTEYLYDLLQMLGTCMTGNNDIIAVAATYMIQFINLWSDAFPKGRKKPDMRKQARETARCYYQCTAYSIGKSILLLDHLQRVETSFAKLMFLCENTNKRIDQAEEHLKELQILENKAHSQLTQAKELSRGAEERERSAYERECSIRDAEALKSGTPKDS